MQSSKGFTLLELMITLTILMVVLGVAAPGFMNLIRSNHAQTQSAAIVQALSLARSEAIKRGMTVYVTSPGGAGNWAQGWRVWADANANGTYAASELVREFPALTGDELTLSAKVYTTSGSTITLGSGAAQLGFDSRGYLASGSPGGGVAFDFDMGSDYCDLGRDIFVNHLGRASTTRKDCDE